MINFINTTKNGKNKYRMRIEEKRMSLVLSQYVSCLHNFHLLMCTDQAHCGVS